ncbi:MAG: PadR family transcriptional regulator, partial [Solirubrobacteraceae bacterium]
SAGGIYPELRRLAEAGLVSVRDNPRGEAPRHCYTITRAGRRALTAWLTDRSDPVLEMRNEALLRLRFAGVLAAHERLALVHRMRDRHQQRITELETQVKTGEFDDVFDRLTTEYALGFNRWARDWCATAEQEILAAA